MDTGLDTAKISYGSRPFILQSPPISIVATRTLGILAIGFSVWVLIAAVYAAFAFGLTQFMVLAGIAAFLGFVGTLTCAFGWKCKYAHETLQIVAYRGKQG